MKLHQGLLSSTRRNDRILSCVFAIFAGLIIRNIKSKKMKCWLHVVFGLLHLLLFMWTQSIFAFLMIFSTISWIKMNKYFSSPRIMFVISMAWKVTLEKYGEHFQFDFTAASTSMTMNVCIRCISFAFEYTEYKNIKNGVRSSPGKTDPLPINHEPTILSTIAYLISPTALCIGPFFTYNTFEHSVQTPSKNDNYKTQLLVKFGEGILLYLAVVVLEYLAPASIFTTENFGSIKYGIVGLAYMTFVALSSSTRLYMIWRLEEASCVSSGIGEYPTECKSSTGKGPTVAFTDHMKVSAYDFETVNNGNGHLWVFATSVRTWARDWNASVHYWLARYCYSTTMIPKKYPNVRFVATQLVNAIWHGVQPGYFIGFLLIFLFSSINDVIMKVVNNLIQTKKGKEAYDISTRIIFIWLFAIHLAFPLLFPKYELLHVVFKTTYRTSLSIIVICATTVVTVELSSSRVL